MEKLSLWVMDWWATGQETNGTLIDRKERNFNAGSDLSDKEQLSVCVYTHIWRPAGLHTRHPYAVTHRPSLRSSW